MEIAPSIFSVLAVHCPCILARKAACKGAKSSFKTYCAKFKYLQLLQNLYLPVNLPMLGGDFMQTYFLLACLIFIPHFCVKVISEEKEWPLQKIIII